jgi:hypothetical protein
LKAPKLLIWVLVVQILLGGALLFAVSQDFWTDDLTDNAKTVTETTPAAVRTVDRFDGKRAFAFLREQVEEIGPRPAGSAASKKLAARAKALLPRGRYETVPKGLRNVVGIVPGTKPAVVVAGHYDTKDEPEGFLGANDGAGGTAAVVELARTFRKLKRPAGAPELRFVLFDGEEAPKGCEDFLTCGVRGAKAYVKAHRRDTRALILLDFIAEKNTRIPREATSDIELWGRLRDAARKVGAGRQFPDEIGPEVSDDHTPFLQAGIPAIDLIDFDFPQWHTIEDDMDVVSESSLDASGESIAQMLLDWPR